MFFDLFVFYIQMNEYFCLSWFLHEPKVQANANKNTKCLFCTPELFYLSSSNDSSYWGVRLAGQHGGDTQNKVIIIHEVLLCMLLHVLLQCYNFYIHEYSNHTRYFNLLIASHSLALQCMRLLMKKDKLHPQRNSWSHRRRGGKSLKYKCTAYFWTSRGGGETCLVRVVLFLKVCWSTSAVREWRWGQFPVLTRWERPRGKSCPSPAPQTSSLGRPGWGGETRRDGGRKTSLERKQQKALTKTMWLFASRTRVGEKHSTIATSRMKCSFLMCLLM